MNKIYNLQNRAAVIVHKLRRRLEWCLSSEEGFGTVELVLLLLVLVGLGLIFKDKVSDLVNSIFGKITSQAGKI